MGRRSNHSGVALRDLILDAAEDMIKTGGLASLSAREIAKRVGYSPGTIYNVFENLDDVVLHVEARLLDALDAHLAALMPGPDPARNVHELALAYLQFTHDHPRLWNLLFEHHLPAGVEIPDWYQEKLEGLMRRVESALSPLMPLADQEDVQRGARVLWAGVHGITSLSTADKLSIVTTDGAATLVRDLVTTFLAGLQAQQAPARLESR